MSRKASARRLDEVGLETATLPAPKNDSIFFGECFCEVCEPMLTLMLPEVVKDIWRMTIWRTALSFPLSLDHLTVNIDFARGVVRESVGCLTP